MSDVKETLYDKKYQCPVCEAGFTSKRVKMSAIRSESRDTDFYTRYKGDDPTWYDIIVCPNCGYSAFENGYKDLKEPQKELVRQTVTSRWKQRDFGQERTLQETIEAHLLALACYQVIGVKKSILGKLCLRIAWLYRTQGDPKEMTFLDFAVKNLEQSFTTEHLDDDKDNEIQIMYFLGELNRRLERFTEASRWFGQLVADPELKKRRPMELKVREQMSVVREEYNRFKARGGEA